MKKILGVLIILLTVFNVSIFCFAEDNENSAYQENKDVLSKLCGMRYFSNILQNINLFAT